MKVLYVCSTEDIYGDNKALLNLLPYLENMGVVPVFLVKGESNFFNYLKQTGYTVVSFHGFYAHAMVHNNILKLYVSWIKRIFTQKVLQRDKEFNSLLSIIAKEKVDLIHTNNGICTLGYKLARKLNIPHVWHIREYIDKDANYKFMPCKYIYSMHLKRPINYTIAITDGVKNHFHLNKRTSTIYDGVIIDEELPSIVEEKEDYFLYVGRLAEGKRVVDAIKAFIVFKKENYKSNTKLYIAGEGTVKYTCFLHSIIVKNNMIDDIVFLGYRTDISVLMAKAKALIVPSQFEAFGFITAEAMFYGCPVIGRNTGGTQEQMDNIDKAMGEAVCFRFNDIVELSKLLLELSIKPVSIGTLEEIQKIVSKKYSANTSSKNVFNIYKRTTILKW